MKIYLSNEEVFALKDNMLEFVAQLPCYCVYRINTVHLNDDNILYQVLVYCFEEE